MKKKKVAPEDAMKMVIEAGLRPFQCDRLLYKYAPYQLAEQIVVGGRLLYNQAKKFKDTYELSDLLLDFNIDDDFQKLYLEHHSKVYADAIVKLDKRANATQPFDLTTVTKDELIKSQLHAFGQQRDSIGILCMTESSENEFMWENYADHYDGICFGFDFSILDLNDFYLGFYVKYVDEIPKLNVFKNYDIEFDPMIFEWICTKRKEFASEREVRFIDTDFVGLKPFGKNRLATVCFGYAVSEYRKKVTTELIKKCGYDVVFQEVRINNEKSEFYIVDLQ